MTKKTIAGAVLMLLFSMNSSIQAQEGSECQRIGAHIEAGARLMPKIAARTGADGFRLFRQAVAKSATKAGDNGLASRVEALEPGKPVASRSSSLASCLLRRYLVARYGDRIVTDLQEMVRFKTYAEEGRTNWDASEFGRQRKWLEDKAKWLGLEFKSFDGRVEEI